MTNYLHSQDYQIQLKKGLAANINTTATQNSAVEAEPHYTTDTDTLYLFDGSVNRPAAAQWPALSVTGTYTATLADAILLCAGTFTVTLPPSVANKVYEIKNKGSGTITVDGDSAELVEDAAMQDIYPGEALTLAGDGSQWWII